ncbi:hypothetical protein BX616_005758, partial [Lobosporangium transversale]
MSNPTSLSNINPTSTSTPSVAGGIPASGTSGSEASGITFDPRELHVDYSQFRIGGFLGNGPVSSDGSNNNNNRGQVSGDVDDLNLNEASNSDSDSNSNGNPSASPLKATSTANEKSEQEVAREQRQARFMELLQSGKINVPREEDPFPGRKYTMPVERP